MPRHANGIYVFGLCREKKQYLKYFVNTVRLTGKKQYRLMAYNNQAMSLKMHEINFLKEWYVQMWVVSDNDHLHVPCQITHLSQCYRVPTLCWVSKLVINERRLEHLWRYSCAVEVIIIKTKYDYTLRKQIQTLNGLKKTLMSPQILVRMFCISSIDNILHITTLDHPA